MKKTEIKNTTKSKTPNIPFDAIKCEILGMDYNLSIVFLGEKRARDINKKWRKKDYTPNTLAFPLNDKEGEIVICSSIAYKEAKKNKVMNSKYIGFLLIHSMLHLKGYDHSSRMEKKEEELTKHFFRYSPYEK